MVANLTTPLIGIVSTIAIGRLGDATLLGGVAIASVVFDCLFWLFGFLRMSTLAFTAQALGAGEPQEIARHRCCGASWSPPLIGTALVVLQMPLAAILFERDGRQRSRDARRQNLFQRPDLVGAAGAGQLCRARLADRTGPRQAGAERADRGQPDQCGGNGVAGAGVRRRHRGRRDRRRDRGSHRTGARPADRTACFRVDSSRSRARRCSTGQN